MERAATRSRTASRSGDGSCVFPATWDNLLRLKNAVQEHDPDSTIFPTAGANLGRGTLGIGARFTTLHWPAVEWAMTRAESRRHRESEQHSARAGVRRRRHARGPARHGAVPVHRHERARRASGPERRRHEPRLRAVEAQDGLSSTANRVELQRRSSADRRQVRRARGRAGPRAACSRATSRSTFRPSSPRPQAPADAAAWVKAHVPAELVDRVRARVASVGLTLNEAEFVEAARVRLAGAARR